jgi:hypothetical protein
MKSHPSSWSLERNERAPAQAPSHAATARRSRPRRRPNRSGRCCRSYLCSIAGWRLHRLRRSGHRRRLREGRSVHLRCRRGRPHSRRRSMDRLSHHSHQRHPCRLPPRTRRCCWDNRRPRLRKCRRSRRGCSSHRRCTSCPGSRNCLRLHKPGKWQFRSPQRRPNWPLCRCGFRRSHSKVGQCHRTSRK